jgi:uncharacterized protein (DUF1697 family)
MEIYLCILRGINVSGQKKINMQELKVLFGALGYSNIRTYIQSGNVVFSHAQTKPEELASQIKQKIAEQYGFEVPVLIRTKAEWQQVVDNNPFLQEKDMSTDKLHVTFLANEPQQVSREKLKEFRYEPDRFILEGKEVYIFCPGSYGETKLSNAFFESKLKVTATTRNWKTVNELAKMAALISA